jgi:sulfopyruvate decarboxylase subunit beta
MVKRHECLKHLATIVASDEIVVSGIGHNEWDNLHPSDSNLFIGAMGYVAPLSFGMALALPKRRVVSMEGDGSILMGIGVLATIGWKKPTNLILLIFDNESFESPGGLPTSTSQNTDLVAIGKSCGVNSMGCASLEEFKKCIEVAFSSQGPHIICAKVESGTLRVPPGTVDGQEGKYRFVRYIESREGRNILAPTPLSPNSKKIDGSEQK